MQLNKRYRTLSLKYHPDRGGDEVMFKKINRAHKVRYRTKESPLELAQHARRTHAARRSASLAPFNYAASNMAASNMAASVT